MWAERLILIMCVSDGVGEFTGGVNVSWNKENPQDYAGRTFNRLTVIEAAGRTRHNKPLVLCTCSCGKTATVLLAQLKNGKTKSCGCLHLERTSEAKTTHGESRKTPEYRAWSSMKRRCYNQKTCDWENYGKRGIEVCSRWKHSFENFLEDMGRKPDPSYSIDRIDVNAHYGPENCRWASPRQQANNKTNSRLIEHKGTTRTLAEWTRWSGLPYKVLQKRIDTHKWSFERAVSTPMRNNGN